MSVNDKQGQVFPLLVSVMGKQQALLADVLPAIHEIREAFRDGQAPSPEQLYTWREKSQAFDKTFWELSGEVESLYASAFDGVATN